MSKEPENLELFPEIAEEEKKQQAEKAGRKRKPGTGKRPVLSVIQNRAIETAVSIGMDQPERIAYQHTVLCQTSLPYRNPGDDVLRWEREQGAVSLVVNAGETKNPKTGKWKQLGLPFGPKARLILHHLNTEAIKTGEPVIEVEDSMTAFVSRIQGYAPNGREIGKYKNQLARMAAATLRFSVTAEDRALQINTEIVTAFDLWFPKDKRERILWPSTVELSSKYFQSLVNHAVPLDERAIAVLSHSALALDLYSWLAQRLHRVSKSGAQFITWAAIKDQFGQGFGRMDNFKRKFHTAMLQVLVQYPNARVEACGKGLRLFNSPPPVQKRLFTVKKPGDE